MNFIFTDKGESESSQYYANQLNDGCWSGEIEEAAEICKEYNLDCKITDEQGFTKGYAHADGSWRWI